MLVGVPLHVGRSWLSQWSIMITGSSSQCLEVLYNSTQPILTSDQLLEQLHNSPTYIYQWKPMVTNENIANEHINKEGKNKEIYITNVSCIVSHTPLVDSIHWQRAIHYVCSCGVEYLWLQQCWRDVCVGVVFLFICCLGTHSSSDFGLFFLSAHSDAPYPLGTKPGTLVYPFFQKFILWL